MLSISRISIRPLLFAQLTDNSYYLIHKWGNDLAWYKKYLYLPLQTPVIFFATLLCSCALLAARSGGMDEHPQFNK